MSKKLIDPVLRKYCAYGLRKTYPDGPDKTHGDLVRARLMVEEVVDELSALLGIVGHPIRLAIEAERRRNELPVVRGLIVYINNADGHGGRTQTIPMSVSLNVCKIGGNPVYLATNNGGPDLMAAILDAVEEAMVGEMTARVERATSYDDFSEEVF